jgi:prolipoprotein diacylglyceryltransferase
MKLYILFCHLIFLVLKTEKENTPLYFGIFLVLLFSVRIVVESVKESQGGFESTLGLLSTGQWLSIPLYSLTLFYLLQKKRTE